MVSVLLVDCLCCVEFYVPWSRYVPGCPVQFFTDEVASFMHTQLPRKALPYASCSSTLSSNISALTLHILALL